MSELVPVNSIVSSSRPFSILPSKDAPFRASLFGVVAVAGVKLTVAVPALPKILSLFNSLT